MRIFGVAASLFLAISSYGATTYTGQPVSISPSYSTQTIANGQTQMGTVIYNRCLAADGVTFESCGGGGAGTDPNTACAAGDFMTGETGGVAVCATPPGAGGGISLVEHDTTLGGLGTLVSPLGVNFSTITSALSGKQSTTAPIPNNNVDLSTVTAALSGKLSSTAPIASNLIDLSTVTTGLSGKLSTTAQVPSNLVDLSTTAAIAHNHTQTYETKVPVLGVDFTNAGTDRALATYDNATGKFKWATSTTYLPSSLSVPVGTINSGDVSALNAKDDLNILDVQEVTGVPGFEIQVTYNGVDSFNVLRLTERYIASPTSTHLVEIGIWNHVSSAWDVQSSVQNQNGYVSFDLSVANSANYIAAGSVIVRFYHPITGNGAHNILIDEAVLLDSLTGGGGITDHSALTGLQGTGVHPASSISNIAAGNIAASDVQSAINELDTEKQSATAHVPNSNIDLSTVTTALSGKASTFVGITSTCLTGYYLGEASFSNGIVNGGTCQVDAGAGGGLSAVAHDTTLGGDGTAGNPLGVNFSTITTALSGKLSTTAPIAPNLIDLSTVTTALSGKQASGSYLTATSALAPNQVDLSTVTTALSGKQATGNYVTALTGQVTASGPGSVAATIVGPISSTAIDLSTVTTALSGKQATGNYITALTGAITASGPGSVAATIVGPVPVNGVNLSTVTTRFQLVEASTGDLYAVKLSTGVTVPANLINLSTVTTALGSKAASGANGDITSLTALTAGGLPNLSVYGQDIALSTIPLADLNQSGAALNNVIAWDGAKWTPTAPGAGSTVGITSACATGEYLDNADFLNGVTNGGTCVAVPGVGGGETNTYTSSKTFTQQVQISSGLYTLGNVVISNNWGLNAGIGGATIAPCGMLVYYSSNVLAATGSTATIASTLTSFSTFTVPGNTLDEFGDSLLIECVFQNGGTAPGTPVMGAYRGTQALGTAAPTTASATVYVKAKEESVRTGFSRVSGEAWTQTATATALTSLTGSAGISQQVYDTTASQTYYCKASRASGGAINFVSMKVSVACP